MGLTRSLVVAVAGAVLAALPMPVPAHAQPPPAISSPAEDYAEMGFGIFLHYGLATFVGQTPWQYDPHDVPTTRYDPSDFNPGQWMDAIKSSGAKYVILTAKHHDGFVLWPSAYTDYGVETSSDPNTDVVGEVVSAARARDLKVVLYYSWYDKLQPGGDVRPKDPASDRTTKSPEYLAYVKNQLTELLTDYGDVEGIWLDIAPMDDVQLPELAEHVHSVSPGSVLVPNFPNAIRDANPAADVATFEGPMELMPCDYNDKPAEQAFNISAGPGWWQANEDPPSRTVSSMLAVRHWVNELGATLSLNVPPGPSGRIPPASVDWLRDFGDADYTPPPPYQTLPDGRLRYDDTGLRCQTGGIQYSPGQWQAGPWDGAWNGTRHISNTPGATGELTFSGDAVSVMAQQRPGHGIAAISVDGRPEERVDTYSPTPQDQESIWEMSRLGQGQHTLRIRVTGEKNPAASNAWIGLDAITVTPPSQGEGA